MLRCSGVVVIKGIDRGAFGGTNVADLDGRLRMRAYFSESGEHTRVQVRNLRILKTSLADVNNQVSAGWLVKISRLVCGIS